MALIDWLRQYDIIKKMERMGKSVGMIAGQAEPTIIQPQPYRTRFQVSQSVKGPGGALGRCGCGAELRLCMCAVPDCEVSMWVVLLLTGLCIMYIMFGVCANRRPWSGTSCKCPTSSTNE